MTHVIHTVRMEDVEVVRTDRWQYGPIRMRHVSCTDDEVEIQSVVWTNPNATCVSTEVTAQLSWQMSWQLTGH